MAGGEKPGAGGSQLHTLVTCSGAPGGLPPPARPPVRVAAVTPMQTRSAGGHGARGMEGLRRRWCAGGRAGDRQQMECVQATPHRCLGDTAVRAPALTCATMSSVMP